MNGLDGEKAGVGEGQIWGGVARIKRVWHGYVNNLGDCWGGYIVLGKPVTLLFLEVIKAFFIGG